MYVVGGELRFTATDLADYLECEHLQQLEIAAAWGKLPRPTDADPAREVVQRRGMEHERRFLERLRREGRWVAEIPWTGADHAGLVAARAATLAALRAGADAIYQAALSTAAWIGYADFLLRVETPSALGSYSYEIVDAKLARSARASAVLQMCAYADLLAGVQGQAPARLHLLLGDGTLRSFRTSDYAAYSRSVRRRFEEAVAQPPQTYPEPVEHCAVCDWRRVCEERRRRDDHLSLVADVRRDQIRHLTRAGITTVAELAALPSDATVDGIRGPVLDRLRAQARLQLRQRADGAVTYELLPPRDPNLGLGALPPPSEGDLFFDMEGDPFAEVGKLEYLFGIVEIVAGAPVYHAFWAHDRREEKRAFEQVVDFFVDRLARHPDLHIYHYAAYEPAALKRLMGEHATREREIDNLLRAGTLVDLYRIVRQSVLVSQDSYSIKKLEPLYMGPRAAAVADAASSIVAYEQWLATQDPAELRAIADYNREDCVSLWRLRDWLEDRRVEAETRSGEPIPRRVVPEPTSEEPTDAELEAEALIAALTAGLPDDPSSHTPEQRGRWLAAHLTSWHRREEKPDWWAYFERTAATDEDLVEDGEAIGGLTHVGIVGTQGAYEIHRYRFEPQEHRIAPGQSPENPRTRKSVGPVLRIDNRAGVIELRRKPLADDPHPTSLVPGGPPSSRAQRDALRRLATWIAEHAIDAPGPYRAVRDLLLRRPPRLVGQPDGLPLQRADESVTDAARRLVAQLDESYLAIQGPPGTGKTDLGAQLIVDLIAAGHRVGIAAHTHRAIANLLEAACQRAADRGLGVVALQRAAENERCDAPGVEIAVDNARFDRRLARGSIHLLAGTPWLFARPELESAVDVLFVDEAAQISLANVVAMGAATRNLVLLGDPCQLAQPSKGNHPPGAEASALGHVLGDAVTIPPELGLLLTTTWRLHPELCRFVSEIMYEGLLESHPSCAAQLLNDGDLLAGAGARYWPVEHVGNRSWCAEEAEVIGEAITALLRRRWTDRNGETRQLTLDDLLVVTPYNAQVARLVARLPEGARVGTVDRFQGQEAPIVFVSMATSTAEELPRAMDFLFSLNRLNVAVSRARSLAVLVCNPGLLRIRCRTPEEMRLVNAYCRFIEFANEGEAGR